MAYAIAQGIGRARARRTLGRRILGFAPVLAAALPLLAIAAGLAGTGLMAFGVPFDDPFAAGGHALTLRPWRALAATPGLATSIGLTLWTGICATLLSVALALLVCAWAQGRGIGRRALRSGAPLLAAPHSTLALGLGFLIAPGGWLVGPLSSWLSGALSSLPAGSWTAAAAAATGGDAHGLALIAALVLKDTPFLILVIADALRQLPAPQTMSVARTLGYPRAEAFAKLLLPQIYPRIRPAILVVLALSLSVVDVALIVGPGHAGGPAHSPTLAVLAWRELIAAGGQPGYAAAAMACLLVAIVIGTLGLWLLFERIVAMSGRAWLERGPRGGLATLAAHGAMAIVALGFAAAALSLATLLAWSFAGPWPVSAAWPQGLSFAPWIANARDVGMATTAALVIAAGATAAALLLAVVSLECEDRGDGRRAARWPWPYFAPFLVPQVAYLFGIRAMLAGTRMDGTWLAAIATQLIVVAPCLFLALAGPWRALDPRHARSARTLGAAPRRVLMRIKLPLLAGPIAAACAFAIAASMDQYLPSALAGSRGVTTLTTQAVALASASGGDRHAIGVYATLQWLLPLLVGAAALAFPSAIRSGRGGVGRRSRSPS